ncbi:MAG TPA: UMP kinase [Solirubrobacteraceae bacterium]|nr:UMP kinase [Solirubrobacteraceae bacterium]
MASLRYRRVVVKLSGRAFAGASPFGLDSTALGYVADQLIAARELGVEEAVVVGGGNFFRGNVADEWDIERAEADNIGMLGTVMNGILLRGVLKHRGLEDVRLMTALPMPSMAEPFIRLRALSHLERERLVLLACGIGQPYVTTDYPAVQRAIELRADAILLAKHGTDGIYDRDPRREPGARRYDSLRYSDVLERDLRVMDQAAIVLARDYELPLHVFDFDERDAISAICCGENRGTYISPTTRLVQSTVAPVA